MVCKKTKNFQTLLHLSLIFGENETTFCVIDLLNQHAPIWSTALPYTMLTMVTKAGKPTLISPTILAHCLLCRTIAQRPWESQVSLRPVLSHFLAYTFYCAITSPTDAVRSWRTRPARLHALGVWNRKANENERYAYDIRNHVFGRMLFFYIIRRLIQISCLNYAKYSETMANLRVIWFYY